ncbi:MAG: hypothetical protein ACLUB2_05600 [Butyricicoccus pullicaecorum]
MFFESRERARRNPAQYPKTANQTFTEKRAAPSVPNRSQPVKDTGETLRKRTVILITANPMQKCAVCDGLFGHLPASAGAHAVSLAVWLTASGTIWIGKQPHKTEFGLTLGGMRAKILA